MSEYDEFMYDELESVKYIKNFLPEEVRKEFSDEDILYIVDLMYDFYDSKGYLDENKEDEEVLIDEEELIAYVMKQSKKDNIGKTFDSEHVALVVQGELNYCDSINLFD